MDVTHLVFHSNLDLLMSKLKVESALLTSCLSQENNPSPLPAHVQAGGTLRSYQKTIEKIVTMPKMMREMNETLPACRCTAKSCLCHWPLPHK